MSYLRVDAKRPVDQDNRAASLSVLPVASQRPPLLTECDSLSAPTLNDEC